MKKSEIYKYALASVIKDLVAENYHDGADVNKTYAIVNEICNKIDTELLCEKRGSDNA